MEEVGPYLSERQWGTVREDYSDDGNAWGYFSHDQARSRAYHWGEDGIRYLKSGIADVARVRSKPSKQGPVEAVTSVSAVSD